MTNIMTSTRISVIIFTMLVSHSLYGMKSPSPEGSQKKFDIQTNNSKVAISPRNKTKANTDVNSKKDFDSNNTTATTFPNVNGECDVKIDKRSKGVFQQILKHHEPHFVQFHIKFSKPVSSTKDVFQPGRWYWTYRTASKTYQFLSWNLHYGIYTFGLLDHKTSLVPFVKLRLYGNCNLTLGEENTSKLITGALVPVINFTSASNLPGQYKESYFCYLSVKENIRNTLSYHASVYLLYPVIFLNYRCCHLKYNFTDESFKKDCSQDVSQMIKWTGVINFNIILGLVIIAYCPILLFQLFSWLGENDRTNNNENGIELIQNISERDEDNDDDDVEWIFANEKPPLTFFDVMSFKGLGVDRKWPVLVSRVRRFLCLLLAPSVIYIEMLMYRRGIGVWKQGDKITVKDFIDVGTPVGFLSFMGDLTNRNKVFVPALGGPIGIATLYFALGFSYLVLPKCLKQILENALPNSDVLTVEGRINPSVIKSPLSFGAKDVIKMAQIYIKRTDLEPGYSKGVTLMKCNFYMLFTMHFWRQVYRIQTGRVRWFTERMSVLKCLLNTFFIPVYAVVCSFEILFCILYFGIPFIFFMVVMVKGAVKMIPYPREMNTLCSYLFCFRFTRGLGVVALFVSSILFAYCVFLLVVGSFKFISQVIAYCFVAVIVYPSVSFGNLFLLVVIVYYIIRQLKYFSYNYTRLLSTAVEVSKRISETPNYVTCFKGHLLLSNLDFANLRQIEINGQRLDVSQNVLINTNTDNVLKIKTKDKCFGIPKDLFNLLIQKYRPVHTYVLSLLLRISILICCVLLFLSITQNYLIVHEDQISEVLHVVFVIVVGALPKLIETNFINQNSKPLQKIEKLYIEQSIVEYWTQRGRLIDE